MTAPNNPARPRLAARTCRLLIDPPAAGAWNMAVDELLLNWSAETGACTLRFYRWSEPTLSLGYFQEYDGRMRHPSSRDLAVVRRLSGGGAILHDRELTYSLTMPGAAALADDSTWLYMAVHQALVDTLAGFGIVATGSAGPSLHGPAEQPFLCFQRRSPGDVLFAGAKICGSAQRRRRGALLQHGSLILARSPAAPELPGLRELSARPIGHDELIVRWSQAISRQLNLECEQGALAADLAARAETLVIEKYDNQRWTRRR
jgi:lipoyl(octanoyl) transferase